jgi:dienelactone hydrolase
MPKVLKTLSDYGKEYVDYGVPPGCAPSPEVLKTQSQDYHLTEMSGKAGKDGKLGENWFLAPRGYFDNKLWNRGIQGAISAAQWGSGEIGEIDRVGKRLLRLVADHGYKPEDWYTEWLRMAEHVEDLGEVAEAKARYVTASGAYRRASQYYQYAAGKKYNQDGSPSKDTVEAYRKGVVCFKKAIRWQQFPKVEAVEVPFEGKSLPAYFVQSPMNPMPSPTMLIFDGAVLFKEGLYIGFADEFAKRGIACLIVDTPGNGESLMLRGMHARHDSEKSAGACLDYLETRPDVDPHRIGITALSLGGFYAPRAAAFEKRLKVCAAWGPEWDYRDSWIRRWTLMLEAGPKGYELLDAPLMHKPWMLGAKTWDEAFKKLEGFNLRGVAEKITCPFLLVHGEEDGQEPTAVAERLFGAVRAKNKTLKIFSAEEGGSMHCSGDNRTLGLTYICDWVVENL